MVGQCVGRECSEYVDPLHDAALEIQITDKWRLHLQPRSRAADIRFQLLQNIDRLSVRNPPYRNTSWPRKILILRIDVISGAQITDSLRNVGHQL